MSSQRRDDGYRIGQLHFELQALIKLPLLIYLTPFKLNDAKFRIPKFKKRTGAEFIPENINAMNIKMFPFSLVFIAKQWRLCYAK